MMRSARSWWQTRLRCRSSTSAAAAWATQRWAPLVDALASNTHLLKLLCGGNRLSADFARDRLLPAVRANASLRKLGAGGGAAAEAEAVVAARAQ
jgi:hypothetical protein